MKLEEKLVHLRKEKGLTQLELAEAIKVSRQAVSKWESGKAIPSTEKLRGLSELYGVPVDFLFSDREEKPEEVDSPPQKAENDSEKISKDRRTAIKFGVIALIFLILIAIIGVAIAIKNKERLQLEDVRGEEVIRDAMVEFNLEW